MVIEQVSAVNFTGSVDAISERLPPILLCALKHKAFVCIDMEQYQYKAIVLETFKKLLMEDAFRNWCDVGIAVQAYLRETRHDISGLISTIRLYARLAALQFFEQRGIED